MTGDVVATLSVLAATNVGLGWYLGYRSLPAYLAFWCLCVLVGITASRIARGAFRGAGTADAILRAGIIVFALVVLGRLTLGSIGRIGIAAYVGFFAACCALSMLVPIPRDTPGPAAPGIPFRRRR